MVLFNLERHFDLLRLKLESSISLLSQKKIQLNGLNFKTSKSLMSLLLTTQENKSALFLLMMSMVNLL